MSAGRQVRLKDILVPLSLHAARHSFFILRHLEPLFNFFLSHFFSLNRSISISLPVPLSISIHLSLCALFSG